MSQHVSASPTQELEVARKEGVGGVSNDQFEVDLERKHEDDAHLLNTTVSSFTWQDVTVTVKDNKTGKPKAILEGIEGIVKAGG